MLTCTYLLAMEPTVGNGTRNAASGSSFVRAIRSRPGGVRVCVRVSRPALLARRAFPAVAQVGLV